MGYHFGSRFRKTKNATQSGQRPFMAEGVYMRSECYTMLKSYAQKFPDRLTDATLAEVQNYYFQTQKEEEKYGSNRINSHRHFNLRSTGIRK